MTDPTQLKKCRGCKTLLYRRRPENERKWNLREYCTQGCSAKMNRSLRRRKRTVAP